MNIHSLIYFRAREYLHSAKLLKAKNCEIEIPIDTTRDFRATSKLLALEDHQISS